MQLPSCLRIVLISLLFSPSDAFSEPAKSIKFSCDTLTGFPAVSLSLTLEGVDGSPAAVGALVSRSLLSTVTRKIVCDLLDCSLKSVAPTCLCASPSASVDITSAAVSLPCSVRSTRPTLTTMRGDMDGGTKHEREREREVRKGLHVKSERECVEGVCGEEFVCIDGVERERVRARDRDRA